MKAEEKSVVGNKSSFDNLFDGVLLSEPLKTFKDNLDDIITIIGISGVTIEKTTKEAGKRLKKSEDMKRGSTKQISEISNTIMVWNDLLGKKLIKEFENIIKFADKLYIDMDQDIKRGERVLRLSLTSYFIYIYAVWEAFVFDTGRAILLTNPHLSSDEVESKVEKLAERKKLIGRFKDWWGIDWRENRFPLREEEEIRARRNIWVHNRGVINQQYVTAAEGNPEDIGNIAEITPEYIFKSIVILVELAKYIHKVANEKHYNKSL